MFVDYAHKVELESKISMEIKAITILRRVTKAISEFWLCTQHVHSYNFCEHCSLDTVGN